MTMSILSQSVLVAVAVAMSAATMSLVVLQNFRENEHSRGEHKRFFSAPRNLELALLVYACTFVSQSKTVIWHHLKKILRQRFSCGTVTLGLIHVSLSMVCISLFDFRIIHVAGNSRLLRSSILFADLTSLFTAEAAGITYEGKL